MKKKKVTTIAASCYWQAFHNCHGTKHKYSHDGVEFMEHLPSTY